MTVVWSPWHQVVYAAPRDQIRVAGDPPVSVIRDADVDRIDAAHVSAGRHPEVPGFEFSQRGRGNAGEYVALHGAGGQVAAARCIDRHHGDR